MAAAVAIARAPLGDLPLAHYVLSSNIQSASTSTTTSNATISIGLPSPVSMPLKRGPPSAHARDDTATIQTLKRSRERMIAAKLDEDELGTGKSPARRLFSSVSSHQQITPSSSSHRSAHTLAPSPPLASTLPRRSNRLAQQQRRVVTRPAAPSTSSVHYPGFQILSDDDPRARSHKPTVQRVWNDKDEENVPPPSVPTAPNTGRRIKNFERSKLGSQSVTASSSPPVRRTGKAALKREAEGDAEYEGIVV